MPGKNSVFTARVDPISPPYSKTRSDGLQIAFSFASGAHVLKYAALRFSENGDFRRIITRFPN